MACRSASAGTLERKYVCKTKRFVMRTRHDETVRDMGQDTSKRSLIGRDMDYVATEGRLRTGLRVQCLGLGAWGLGQGAREKCVCRGLGFRV